MNDYKWYSSLEKELTAYGIQYQKTTFTITDIISSHRDNEWMSYIRRGLIVKVVKNEHFGSSLSLVGKIHNGFDMEIGSVSVFDKTANIQFGIVGTLEPKTLKYKNGTTASCLLFTQPVYLLSELPPDAMLNSETLNLKTQATKLPDMNNSYIGCGCFVLLFLFIWFMLAC